MKYSNARIFLEYILIVFSSYLIISGIIALIGGYNYRFILTSPVQIPATIFFYWWIPIPRVSDMANHNNK